MRKDRPAPAVRRALRALSVIGFGYAALALAAALAHAAQLVPR